MYMSATCAWIIIFCMKVEKDVEIGSATKKIIVHGYGYAKLTSRESLLAPDLHGDWW